jgi:predicted dehydrogenase
MAGVDAVVVGAGNRGCFVFGGYALANPDRLRIAALAEPDDEKREGMAREHAIPQERRFRDWNDLLGKDRLATLAIVATGDTLHVEPTLAALARGYHVLLEKPIAPTPGECVRVVDAAEKAQRILQIGHVLRYTPFYRRVHEIIESGVLGDLVSLDLREHVAYWHMTHSFVRGKFRNRELAAPIILAKSCHDLDLMVWFVGRPALRVSSFGSVTHFRAASAPSGAPERCTDGCPARRDCPHDAERFYLGPDDEVARIWPWSDVSLDSTREARRRALETGRYGRCVYRCDNDVADHQVVAVEFEGGATASLTVQGLGSEEERTVRLSGTRGELSGVLQSGVIEVSRHGVLGSERHEMGGSALGHYGGDGGLLDHLTEVVERQAGGEIRASGRVSLESHLLGFAAEEARLSGAVVEMERFRIEARRAARGDR